jgi:hypothetical protein
MDTVFTLGDGDDGDKINLDELYEQKQTLDMSKMNTFNKILNRIHNKIKTISRQNVLDQFCWYLVPEVIIGVPKYNHGDCVAYIIDKLTINGFNVRYTHPNLLFISWKHWVPGYVRSEIKKKTGIAVDGYGNKIIKKDDNSSNNDPNTLMFQSGKNIPISQNKKNDENFKSINSYKPTGNLIYNNNLLKKLEDKFQ